MYSKKIAIIVAGGTGQRMGSVVPKQFLEIEGKSILLHTIAKNGLLMPSSKVVSNKP